MDTSLPHHRDPAWRVSPSRGPMKDCFQGAKPTSSQVIRVASEALAPWTVSLALHL